MDLAEAEVLDLFRGELLNPAVVKRALQLAVDQLRPATDKDEAGRRHVLQAMRQVEIERARFVEAIRRGADPELFLEADHAAKGRQDALGAQLQRLEAAARLHERFDDRAVWEDLSARLTDWQGLLSRTPSEARPVLRELMKGRLIMTPTKGEDGAWYYTLSGTATYGRLLSGIVRVENLPMELVPPG